MKKHIIIIVIVTIILILISIFSIDFYKYIKGLKIVSYSEKSKNNIAKLKIGLITGFGGLGDKSFNDMQYNGLILSKKLYNIDFEYFTPDNFEDIKRQTQILIDNKCNLIIIGEGYIGQDVIDFFAPKYPEIKFVVLDSNCQRLYSNSASILFKQNESSFLAGFIASKITKKNRVGFIGGIEIDIIRDFLIGYEQGIVYGKRNCKLEVDYISNYVKDFEKVWNSPKISYEIAKKMILKKGIDIIYSVTAASNIGIFNACKEFNIFSIGVDTDQDYIIPGTILTSVLKNLDQAIIFIVKKVIDNQFEPKSYHMGLKENGVGLSPMLYTKEIIGEDLIRNIAILQQQIIKGDIIVKSFFDKED